MSDASGDGLRWDGGLADSEITGSTIDGASGDGIRISGGFSRLTVEENAVSTVLGSGLRIEGAGAPSFGLDRLRVAGNRISGAGEFGVVVDAPGAGSDLEIAGNVIESLDGATAHGVRLGPGVAAPAPEPLCSNVCPGTIDPVDCVSVASDGAYGADLDGDGGVDACDVCPADPLDDRDRDGTCGDRDNCPARWNATQTDRNGDGDPCDLDDGLIFVWFDDPLLLQWDDEPVSAGFDVFQGRLDGLRAGGSYTPRAEPDSLDARTCGVTSPWLATFDGPWPDDGIFLLVGASGASDLGVDGRGVPRPIDRACPAP